MILRARRGSSAADLGEWPAAFPGADPWSQLMILTAFSALPCRGMFEFGEEGGNPVLPSSECRKKQHFHPGHQAQAPECSCARTSWFSKPGGATLHFPAPSQGKRAVLPASHLFFLLNNLLCDAMSLNHVVHFSHSCGCLLIPTQPFLYFCPGCNLNFGVSGIASHL